MRMKSSRPYVIRSLYEWITDNQLTPYLLVDADYEGVDIPKEYVRDGRIVLNISPDAVESLHIDNKNESILFFAGFSGVSRRVFLPVDAVMAIYAQENEQGVVFEHKMMILDPTVMYEHDGLEEVNKDIVSEHDKELEKNSQTSKSRRSHLRVVK